MELFCDLLILAPKSMKYFPEYEYFFNEMLTQDCRILKTSREQAYNLISGISATKTAEEYKKDVAHAMSAMQTTARFHFVSSRCRLHAYRIKKERMVL